MAKSAALRKVPSKMIKALKKAATIKPKTAKIQKPKLKVVKPAAKKPVAKPATKKVAKPVLVKNKPAAKPAAKPQAKPAAAAPAKKEAKREGFRVNDYVVYPTHGVGKIIAQETQEIGGMQLPLFVIMFDRDRMTLRVPVSRATAAGLRHVSGNDDMQKMFTTLKSRARTSRGMWSRRAQEYEMKINSGNILSIAEVVRDLHPNVDQAERSYSERMIYENALNRLVGEFAAFEGMEQKLAADKLLKLLRSKMAA